MKFRFIKTPTNRKFNLSPVFYDEAKEKREERERRIREELGLLDESADEASQSTYRDRIKGSMRPQISSAYSEGRQQKRTSNLRFVVIVIVLGILFYRLASIGFDWLAKLI